jgi:hypothetical protein
MMNFFFFTLVFWCHRPSIHAADHFQGLQMAWVRKRFTFPKIPPVLQFCICLLFGLPFSVGKLSAEDHRLEKDGGAYGEVLEVQAQADGEKVTPAEPMLLRSKHNTSPMPPNQWGGKPRQGPFHATACDHLCFAMSPNGTGELQSLSIEPRAIPIRPRVDGAFQKVEFLTSNQSSDVLAGVQSNSLRSYDADNHADNQWLDIRPRTIASVGETSKLFRKEELPGYETRTEFEDNDSDSGPSQAVDYYRFDLRLRDFCRVTRFCHGPLYFENRLMESQGVSPGQCCCPPAVYAGAHFIWSAATLPLHVLRQPPCNSVCSGCQCR